MKDCSTATTPVMTQGQKNSSLNFMVGFVYFSFYACIKRHIIFYYVYRSKFGLFLKDSQKHLSQFSNDKKV